MKRMLRGLLAGAGWFALVDGGFGLAFPQVLMREALVLALMGALLAATAFRLIFGSLLPRLVKSEAETFWVGVGLALPPFLSNWISPFYLSLLAIPAMVIFAPRLRAILPFQRVSLVAASAPYIIGLLLFLAPSSLEKPADIQTHLSFPENHEPLLGPNVLLVSVDTLRADRVLELADRLPHLTELRNRGSWASFGLATSNQTLPSHVSMLTGLPVLQHGVRDNRDKLPLQNIPFLAERFQEAGWNTAGIVMNGFLRGDSGFSQGFDLYEDTLARRPGIHGAARHATQAHSWLGWISPFALSRIWFPYLLPPPTEDSQAMADGNNALGHAKAILNELNGRNQPWFMFFHLLDPHFPYAPPSPWSGSFFEIESIPESLRENTAGSWDLMRFLEKDIRLVEVEGQTPEQASRHRDARVAARALMDLYDEEILYVDSLMGELIKAASLDVRPTVILFTSDHGEHFGEHDLILHSRGMYEELLRVPFIVVGHGMKGGEMSITPHLEDVAPTLLGLAGLSTDGFPGRDLSQTLSLKEDRQRAHIERAGMELTIRHQEWKLHVRLRLRGNEALELYNLNEDPGEARNLLQFNEEKVQELMKMVETALSHSSGSSERNSNPEQQALLEHLGYVEEGS
ncbi:MAG: sulfatase-like hydrolase/transferase [Planctomycetota bacterium]|nr:sulfatase-like hydrolase/transferase [Planctomycetota bacterium]